MSSDDIMGRTPSLASTIVLRRATVDDFSTLRHLHEQSFGKLAACLVSDDEARAFSVHVRDPAYVDELAATELYVGLVGEQIVASAAWHAGDDVGATARISSVYVDPLFIHCGIGRRLVTEVEGHAIHSGFTRFAVRSTLFAVPFFLRLGYDIASHGVSSQAVAQGVMPVTFMRKSVLQAVTPRVAS